MTRDVIGSRPLPVPDETSEAFWTAAADHVLTLPRCSDCGQFTLPPDVSCPHCHSVEPRFRYEPVSGRGRIRTWTIIRQSFLSGFDSELPFVLVDVELEEHPHVRMIGRLLDGPDATLRIGAMVNGAFEDIAPGVAVPAFALEATP